jgi:glycerol-3-phosphate dehydrogenase
VYSLALNKRQYVTRITLKCFFDVTNSAIVCYIERYRTFVSLNESVRGGERGNQRSDCDRGGINGAGIAADAAGRGLSVLMLEASDLACATSSASSKLIHGGLRYLEHYEFRLVSEALAEREVLLKMAPHIAFPMRFRLPHRPHLRPAWMIRIGLFMYDHLGKRTSLPGSTGLRFGTESVLKPEIVRGFEYSDCWVDDARLVLANAQMVVRKGGEVRTRTRAISAKRENGLWIVEAEDIDSGEKFTWQARGLVNATGPWVKQFFDEGMHLRSPYGIRLIKGSHIVVPRVHTQKQAYILQNEDKRIVFVIPWMDEFSIIGTTDVEYKGDPKAVAIDDNEVNYLLNVYNAHFKSLSRGTISSGPTPACARCATMNPTRRRRSPAITRLIFMMKTGRRRCCRSLAAS